MLKKGKNSKFILPTKENVEQYKLEYFDILFKHQKEKCKRTYEGLEDYIPSDEKIRDIIGRSFNVQRMNNHNTIVPNSNIDYFSYIECIQSSPIEKILVILLDKNKQPIDSKILAEGTATEVGDIEYPYNDIFKYILNNKKCKYFILAHNHPFTVSIKPSSGDYSMTHNLAMLGNIFEIKMLDSIIISEFDFYSQYEYEKQCEKSQSLLKPQIDKKTNYEIFTNQEMLYRFLLRCLGDGL